MAVNPAGFVPIFDFGNPKIVSGYAREVISGGQLVFVSGAADSVSSGANSFSTSDILFATGASGAQFNGVAIVTAGSNEVVSVLTQGAVIVRAGGDITSGYPVAANGADDVVSVAADGGDNKIIGRALTSATSGNFVLVDIK